MARSLLLAVFLFACAHAEPKPVAPPPLEGLRAADLYPLRIGNKWTYEIRAGSEKAVRTVEVVGEQDGFFVTNPPGKFRHDKAGLRDQDRYLIENPVETGHSWMSVLSMQSTERFVITDAGRPCTVQAGTFGRCATVRATNALDSRRSIVIESTYAEGVGLVAFRVDQVVTGQPPVTQQEMELIHYQLAP